MKRLPWDDWLRFAIAILGVPLDRVWSLTPLELTRAYRALSPAATGRMERGDFNDLMRAHPDQGNAL